MFISFFHFNIHEANWLRRSAITKTFILQICGILGNFCWVFSGLVNFCNLWENYLSIWSHNFAPFGGKVSQARQSLRYFLFLNLCWTFSSLIKCSNLSLFKAPVEKSGLAFIEFPQYLKLQFFCILRQSFTSTVKLSFF